MVRWLEGRAREVAALPPQTVRFGRRGRMRVHPIDENGRRVFVHGLDPRERLTRHFIRLLRPGDCVLDVGANVGYYTMVAAELVGPRGCVHAFEASPAVLPWLQTNASLNQALNIRVHGVAVTDQCGEIEFHTAAPDRTGYSSIRALGSGGASTTRVRTIAVDTLLGELPAVRLVKLDIEGAELLALRGMRGVLERDRPFLIFEMDDEFLRELGASARELCAFLTEGGYELHRIVERGDLVPVREPPTERCNVLACPPGPEGLAVGRR